MKVRSVFFGTPDFAIPSLEASLKYSELLAVISQPDRPRGRGQKLSPSPVKARALELGIPVFTPPSLRKESEELNRFKAWIAANEAPDFVLVTAYGNILPQSYLDWPKLGPLNVHASLLPRWRGAAPIQRSLEAGDKESGVSLQHMVFELDAGAVLDEMRMPIGPNDTATDLWAKLSLMGGDLLGRFLEKNKDKQLVGTAQDASQVTLAAKIRKEEGFWQPSWLACETHNRVRAFSMWPGVKAVIGSETVKLVKTRLLEKAPFYSTLNSASLSLLDEGVVLNPHGQSLSETSSIRSGELQTLLIDEIQFQNKASMKAVDALREAFRSERFLALKPVENS